MKTNGLLSIAAVALAGLSLPTQAFAQTYPCGGPGPGERVVGMTQGGPGVAPSPLCAPDDSDSAPSRSSGRKEPEHGDGWLRYEAETPSNTRYTAVAWHQDAADIWVVGNFVYRNDAALAAVAACNAVMGKGCELAGTWWNSSVTIVRDRYGSFAMGWDGNGGAQSKQTMADCSAHQLLPCEVFATIALGSRRSPDVSVRKFYAVSAWATDAAGDDGKLYVASGYRKLEDATNAAIKACSDATRTACKSNALTGNGVILAYRLNGGEISATSETSAARARAAAQAACNKQANTSCEIQAVFDSRRPGLFVHDFKTGQTR
ncbi:MULTISPECIES: DUF4189 domain-containing protein [unclassified Burkholderia]|uniref:DUF4189 domain-containing protein n=1 Tax=unclassified Burkholderia TaxID=2613784 RepID=UPI00075389FC|nr:MULTISPECIES: DUF4189 domain-containing protein [unclassified Burkholderia]KVL22218.1 hypothetical protein WS95_08515 [Burkholderia sp. MSMB1826]KWE52970.1 hypothetical protein WT53_26635 [Burkholderia sp. MSMB2157WGS]